MAPEAKSEDLLYVSDGNGAVFVFTYPLGKLVGELSSGFISPDGLCSDRAGNIFVTDIQFQRVLEFAHGGTSPINAFYDVYDGTFTPTDCAVDPVTGNLAVLAIFRSGGIPGVVVWPKAQGKPIVYWASLDAAYMLNCTYDAKGNLFFDQVRRHGRLKPTYIGELPSGSGTFRYIKLSKSMGAAIGIQWDGKYVAVEDGNANVVYRVRFSGSSGTVISTLPLNGATSLYQFWIQGRRLIGPDINGSVEYWKYPAGGPILWQIIGGFSSPLGVTVSVSP